MFKLNHPDPDAEASSNGLFPSPKFILLFIESQNTLMEMPPPEPMNSLSPKIQLVWQDNKGSLGYKLAVTLNPWYIYLPHFLWYVFIPLNLTFIKSLLLNNKTLVKISSITCWHHNLTPHNKSQLKFGHCFDSDNYNVCQIPVVQQLYFPLLLCLLSFTPSWQIIDGI